VCKAQRLMCASFKSDCPGHDPEASRWTGDWPGERECRERGWYAVMRPDLGACVPNTGNWWPCTKDYPGANEDLNRWSYVSQTGVDQFAGAPILGRDTP
jgi:hypothetical protein